MKHLIGPRGSYFDEDDDSGADSLSNDCHHGFGSWHRQPHPRPPSSHGSGSMALVPYDPGSSGCYGHRHDYCCHHPHSTALQTLPGVEDRLMQLEGDKDTLHLQVSVVTVQIRNLLFFLKYVCVYMQMVSILLFMS